MHVKFLETLDWSILIAYFLILIAIGAEFNLQMQQNSD